MATVKTVTNSFEYLYEKLLDREFRKTFDFHKYGEQELLPLVRTYLLGQFEDKLQAEVRCDLPGAAFGRLDFVVGGTAIELAVRKPWSPKATLSRYVNTTEVWKLLRWKGRGVLVLYDFSRYPYTSEELDQFRDWPSLGKGSFKLSAFTLAYFNRGSGKSHDPDVITKTIRAR